MKHYRFGLCLVMTASLAMGQDQPLQGFSLLVLNAKTGKPFLHESLLLFLGTTSDRHSRILHVMTDERGLAHVPVEKLAGDSVKIFSEGLTTCYGNPNVVSFRVEQVTGSGLVTPNGCGSATTKAIPGQLTVFARRMTLAERMAI